MASSVNLGPLPWMDGPTFNSQIMRLFSTGGTFFNSGAYTAAATVNGGVIPGTGEFTVTAGSGMAVNVAAGNALIPSGAGAIQGGYLATLATSASLSIATADPTNPRIDLVYVQAEDLGGSGSYGQVAVATGTPAPSPSVPSTPSGALPLYTVTVPAGASSSSSFTISSVLYWTTPAGGIMPVWGTSGFAQGYNGHYVHDRNSGRLIHNSASGPVQPILLPFTPVQTSSTATQNEAGSSETTSLSLSITTDGATDWEIYYKVGGIVATQSGAPAMSALWRMYIDTSQVDAYWGNPCEADGNKHQGAAWSYYTSASLGSRPSAGTHTVKVTWQTQVSFGISLYAAGGDPIILRAQPVTL
jgi:hypothetical protein